jgi:hypothetical protein
MASNKTAVLLLKPEEIPKIKVNKSKLYSVDPLNRNFPASGLWIKWFLLCFNIPRMPVVLNTIMSA